MRQGTLAAILAVQIVAVFAVWGFSGGSDSEPDAFLDINSETIDKLIVSDGDSSVELLRVDDGWNLSDGLPADADKVESVIEKLADATGGWPVGTTDSIAERFEVTEEKFQRRVTASVDDAVIADVFLGTSPAFRKVHARHADGGPVYSITFSNYEAGADSAGWLDKGLLRPEGKVKALTRVDGFALASDGAGWTMATNYVENAAADATDSGAEGNRLDQQLDQQKVEQLVGRFTSLNVIKPSDAELPDTTKFQFVIEDSLGSQTLSIFHLEEDDEYVMTSSRVAGQYGVSSYVIEQMDVSLDDLTTDKPATVGSAGVGADATPATL